MLFYCYTVSILDGSNFSILCLEPFAAGLDFSVYTLMGYMSPLDFLCSYLKIQTLVVYLKNCNHYKEADADSHITTVVGYKAVTIWPCSAKFQKLAQDLKMSLTLMWLRKFHSRRSPFLFTLLDGKGKKCQEWIV